MDNFAYAWPWLSNALRAGEDKHIGRADVLELLRAQKAQLWPGEGGALVTQLLETPEGRCLHVWLGGGAMRSLLDMRAGLEAWGRQQGCDYATINGRAGWDRVFRPFGYTRVDGELRKTL